ncbi:MAG TPA: DUF1549 and DUF1553 domain-containing protein [Fimbriiglobus sp.]|nr:DUF1549 and DUF1553 domain-containing protein [Fimbriiglobus sp.]
MRTPVCWVAGWAALLAVPASGLADSPERPKEELVQRLTAAIDRHLSADWKASQTTPSPEADDAEYVRRVYLDLVGRTPRVAETRAFLSDKSADKRARLVERLLDMPTFAAHFAAATRADWLPQSLNDFRTQFQGNQFEDWLRRQYAANTPLDELTSKVLTASVAVGQRGRVAFDRPQDGNRDEQDIANFYQANDVKPENLAATVSRVFLGVKLECAQCHDHPFAPYTKDQFWQFAAFFGEFTPLPPVSPSFVGPLRPQYEFNRLTIPNTTKTVTALYFDGESPEWSSDRTPRRELAGWLTSAKNPYFARNLANRTWAHFFGIGIVEPVDEPGAENPPSHPELLAELAAGLIEAKFDQRVLVRAIAASRAYNLTSKQSHETQSDPRRFSRMPLRGLTADQIYDSFLAATGARDLAPRNQRFFDPRNDVGRNAFRTLFQQAAVKTTESQTSILQSLMMMNGRQVTDQTSLASSDVLAAVADAPFLDTEKRVDALFLAALTRKPTPHEREQFASYVERGGPSGDKKKALADVFWVLLNSTEFLFNH